MKTIIKVKFWFNPSSKKPHWGAYVWYSDKTGEAFYNVTEDQMIELVKQSEIK